MKKGKKGLEIFSDWQDFGSDRLDADGGREENSTLGYFVISDGDSCLTEGVSKFGKQKKDEKRPGPLVSAYYPAKWFAWNWWRLCYEPASENTHAGDEKHLDWLSRHHLSSIGNGFVWPNILIESDGISVRIKSEHSADKHSVFDFTSNESIFVNQDQFEKSLEGFIEDVIERVSDFGSLKNTDLHEIWAEVKEERDDPYISFYRCLEALLGADPDEADKKKVLSLISDRDKVGEETVFEMAAFPDNWDDKKFLTVDRLQKIAKRDGYDSNLKEALSQKDIPLRSTRYEAPLRSTRYEAPWKIGERVAQEVRNILLSKEANDGFIPNEKLAGALGLLPKVLERGSRSNDLLSFTTRGVINQSERIVLKSPRETNRRFAAARILGSRIFAESECEIRLFTDANTYSQKMQRAFAAELLCPHEELEYILDSDYSNENRQRAARHFKVSTHVVRNIVAHKHWASRSEVGLADY